MSVSLTVVYNFQKLSFCVDVTNEQAVKSTITILHPTPFSVLLLDADQNHSFQPDKVNLILTLIR